MLTGATAVAKDATGASDVVGEENDAGDNGRGTVTGGLILLVGTVVAGRGAGAARLVTFGRVTAEVIVVDTVPEFATASALGKVGCVAEATLAGRMGPAANAGGRRVGRLGAS